ncbi:hypothetical protein L1987_49289 [Smallanthus sonchifolius]|uniref:Uncharacterized protein n=1 Tax=Smallanthus sonchifolius TaxID=185202 RepID=A0ACB9FTQ1_9ASTR|nr:hypothetical protein L1987_49289 [Smallanthus sonchifolius]
MKPGREKMVAGVNKSPFLVRGGKGKMVENMNTNEWRRRRSSNSGESLFESSNGLVVARSSFKSLKPGERVYNTVIDVWAEILNYEEKIRAAESPKRLFYSTTTIVEWMLNSKEEDNEKRLTRLRLGIYMAVNRNSKMLDLKTIDMVKDMFVQYLERYKPPKSEEIKKAKIHKVLIYWATTTNVTDCAVFVMRHMEKFMGIHEEFECVFSTNGNRKNAQLKTLRKKYAAHMLLSEANQLKEKVMTEALGKKI